MAKIGLFDFVNAISETKENLFLTKPVDTLGDYNAFMVSQAFSLHPDTILYANELNALGDIPDEQHFAYLHGSIKKKFRRAKWPKKSKDDMVQSLSEMAGMSLRKAAEAASILTDDELSQILSARGGTPAK